MTELIAVIADIIRTTSRDPNVTFEEDAAAVLDAICPPGSRVVVSRESKPCDECAGTGNRFYEVAEGFCDCIGCGGSGVVEATTTYGLEAVTWLWSGPECSHIGGGGCRGPHWGQVPHTFRLVALPEDGA